MRLTISEFARLVGLAPSALRFYDDCGLLPPAEVDAANGYRYYAPTQEVRARLLRDLREIDLPLPEVRIALDAAPSELADLVRSHLRTVEAKSVAVRAAADRLLTQYLSDRSSVVLGGAELASAIRQVAPAAAASDREDAGVLECLLVELGPDELAFVATDRYRLAVRKVLPVEFTGRAGQVLVRAEELVAVGRWAAGAELVRMDVGPNSVVLSRTEGEARELAVVEGAYPAYQGILEGLAPPVCRVVVDRAGLLGTLADRETVAFSIDPVAGVLVVDETPGPVTLDVVGSGTAVQVGFTATLLTAVLEASVGPDVLLEFCATDRPVVVRSADQGTFTTLIMPVRLDS